MAYLIAKKSEISHAYVVAEADLKTIRDIGAAVVSSNEDALIIFAETPDGPVDYPHPNLRPDWFKRGHHSLYFVESMGAIKRYRKYQKAKF
ncbi:hypothetical protein KS4_16020 [Poriferisphaera corsica]|uniref:Uncharacterized protein n=1 Tax=Poriferisphaera corsica TaxID=2528020 RepID=A0A517YTJ6_9BACT|nr:hypothetical protein [Poriferisphaera corsica]QDU33551.1 hypothetical protein KS4_16020 [Poriferisphaera corsica]